MSRKRIAILTALIVLATCAVAFARPGGGDSFSGGGGHGGGGSGGGGGGGFFVFELIWWFFQLIIYYPAIGLPLLALIIFLIVRSAYRRNKNKDWDSGPPVTLRRAIPMNELRRIDPDFSQVVFEDFAFRLFSTAQRVRATADGLATVAPYVNEDARGHLAARPPVGTPVEQVIVGALRAVRIDVPPQPEGARVRIGIELEANVATAAHTYYSVETWWYSRDATRHSKPPSRSKTFPCPNCGAPWQAAATGTQVCANCNQVVDNGRFDWVVDQISVSSLEERPPSLTTETEERGTDLDTYKAPDRDNVWDALTADDPAVTEEALEQRLAMIYDRLNKAWANNALEPVRGFVSDGLFDYLQYWVDAYKREGLRNQLTDMRITKVEYAKVVRDKYYDAVTIRIWGLGKDFVVKSETGKVVRGSKHMEREYSEYWTLIRSAGKKGAPKAEPTCGNCGAPLVVTQSGECTNCSAHVTAGEFDWVLSKIEQDDTYRG
jgi:uncharacterized Zn finger protein (UPF0148 family)